MSYPNCTLISVRIIVPTLSRASSPIYLTLQLISEQYMVELHSPPGRYTILWYLAEYVNTLILLWVILEYNTNPFWFSHIIYTRKVLLPHIIHYHRDPTLSSLCNKTFTWLRFIIYHAWLWLSFCVSTHWNPRTLCLMQDAIPRGRVPRPANIYHEVTMTIWTCHF